MFVLGKENMQHQHQQHHQKFSHHQNIQRGLDSLYVSTRSEQEDNEDDEGARS